MENSILKCFVSVTTGNYNDTQEQKDKATEQGRFFREYIFGEKGISKALEQLKFEYYGEDITLILLQFYVNPIMIEIESLPEIEKYRKRERAIGIPIIVNEENFFKKTEKERLEFLKKSIVSKIDLLKNTVVNLKLDTNIELLKADLIKTWSCFGASDI